MVYLRYLSREVRTSLLIALMAFWCITSTVFLLQKEDKVVLLQMNGLDTRVVEKTELPPVEIENFLYNFVGLFYSYSSENYEDHMNRAAPLFQLSLIKQYVPKINKMYDVISAQKIVQTSFIERIYKVEDFFYELDMNVQRTESSTEKQSNYKIRLKLKKSERTLENPYGLIVTKLEEIYE